MRNPHGSFVWYELITADPDAAAAFYGKVVGWSVATFAGGGMDYRLFNAGGEGVAGFMAPPPEDELPTGWTGYVGVDDVDASVAKLTAAGGEVHVEAMDLPGVGRMAMVADPQGVAFQLMRGAIDQPSTSFAPTRVGHCAWNELATTDQPAALAFYGGLFGWAKGDVMPMGEMGDYQFLTHHGETIGAVMPRRPDGPPPGWTFYFHVADIDAAAAAIPAGGGTVHMGPADVPGGQRIVVASDPQGALFGVVGAA